MLNNPIKKMTKFEKVEEVLVYRCDAGFEEDRGVWYDYSHGSNMEDAQINSWMQDAFAHIRPELVHGVDKTFFTIRSGNTMVLLTAYRQEDDTYELSFVVTKSYKIAEIYNYDASVEVEFVPVEPRG
jgi:hypothetical protein